ncbi:MAG: phosphate ABC transporter permease PstA [Anaerolineae bacterium]
MREPAAADRLAGKQWHAPRERVADGIGTALLWGCSGLVAGTAAVMAGYVAVRGVPSLSWALLTTPPQGGISGAGGISNCIITTVYLVVLTIASSGPLGLATAIYMTEYARDGWTVRLFRFAVEMLAGVPSIIFGLFGYALFVTAMHLGYSMLSAALAIGTLVLPVVVRTSEEALRSVPDRLRQGSLALGMSQWQTVCGVVLPAAMPGVLTGVLLSVGRIISETAVLYVTLGGSYLLPRSLFDGGRTLALHVFFLATESNAPVGKQMATALVLVVLVVAVNVSTELLMRSWKARANL